MSFFHVVMNSSNKKKFSTNLFAVYLAHPTSVTIWKFTISGKIIGISKEKDITDFLYNRHVLCFDQLFIMRLDIRYKDILIPYRYILIRLVDCLSINLFGIYLWYPYTWPISLTYKYILIRNKYILVPYIQSHDK